MQKTVNLANVQLSVLSILILCILEVMTKSSSIQNTVAPNILKDQSCTGTGQQQWITITGVLQQATIILQTVHPIHRKDYCYYGDIIRYASAVAKTPRIY
jgi:hypothetical protein